MITSVLTTTNSPDAGPTVVVRLENGTIIEIAPHFNAVNCWSNDVDYKRFDNGRTTFVFPMGGE